MTGIYVIKNLANGKVYVGQSLDVEKRWTKHKWHLKNNCHHNEHLQSAWDKYGESNFEFTLLEEATEELLNSREVWWIEQLQCTDNANGYNKTYGGLSERPTEEARKRMSSWQIGRKASEETRKRLSESHKGPRNHNYGKPKSNEWKEKVREKHKKRTGPSTSMWGRTHSEETRRKMSATIKKALADEETRQKIAKAKIGISNPMFGKIMSEEEKQFRRQISQGELSKTAKLTEQQVREIKIALRNGSKQNELAKIYGIRKTQMSRIKNGISWSHVVV